VKYELGLLLN